MRPVLLLLLAVVVTACGPDVPDAVAVELDRLPERVDFNQHIRPILSDRCWSCHGPDAKARKAGLRLDTEEGAYATLTETGHTAVVPGKPGSSELVRRILSEEHEVMMPTPESNLTLTDREKALLVRWIEDGAEWKDHWAFLPIEDPHVPDNPAGYPTAQTPVDNFLNARLFEEGLAPAAPAESETLIRRLYQDLTGLPPSLEEIDAWLADPSDAAYRAKVEELMGRDAFAERLTMEWLDVARYADSHGMHADGARTSYPYRDWVIAAFKRNMPYDRFVRYQLAGDLLEDPTRESRLATAFLRMHPMTAEGGAIAEEYRLSYVFDRVNTVATGLLGLTMDCARCHDHKFDPLSQKEYYSFSAFFNTIEELGMTGDDGDFGPVITLADEHTEQLLEDYRRQMGELDARRAEVAVSAEELAAFARTIAIDRPDFALDFNSKSEVDAKAWSSESFAVVDDAQRGRVGEFDHAYDLVDLGDRAQGSLDQPLSVTLWMKTTARDSTKVQALVTTAGRKDDAWRGMELFLDDANRLSLRLTHALPQDQIEIKTNDSLLVGQWYQVGFTYDGSGLASGVQLYVDGRAPLTTVYHDALTGNFSPPPCAAYEDCRLRTMRMGRAWRVYTGDDGIFSGRVDELRYYERELSPLAVWKGYDPTTQPEEAMVRAHLQRNSRTYREATDRLRAVQVHRAPLADSLPKIMVMQEMVRPRQTHLLKRGAYDAPGEVVPVGTPERILAWSADYAQNRAGLADWMLSPQNPLTARVIVNRYWQLIFGQGIVATPHDFGSQGALPTHPRLLDYLSSRFQEGWDVRELLRQLVLSETYRRTSSPTAEQAVQDPDNLLLARGPRYRLPAELIRDNALAASGLLNDTVGGASVFPYQPGGLWGEKSNFSKVLTEYAADHGSRLYRRSMYTFIRRTSPPPFMTTFDAGSRDICLVKRSDTNTPLQALNLLNDPQFVEAARVLAQRVQAEAGQQASDQLRRAFRLVTGRRAEEAELQVLTSLYEEELDRFKSDRAAADTLLRVGEYPVAEKLEAAHTAALTSVSNMLFSMDAAYVKY